MGEIRLPSTGVASKALSPSVRRVIDSASPGEIRPGDLRLQRKHCLARELTASRHAKRNDHA